MAGATHQTITFVAIVFSVAVRCYFDQRLEETAATATSPIYFQMNWVIVSIHR
jgi:hypothetical protein